TQAHRRTCAQAHLRTGAPAHRYTCTPLRAIGRRRVSQAVGRRPAAHRIPGTREECASMATVWKRIGLMWMVLALCVLAAVPAFAQQDVLRIGAAVSLTGAFAREGELTR